MIAAARLRTFAPWWLKISLKIVLSRLRIPYRSWARLGIFRHGSMTDPAYALAVFQKHYDRADFPGKGNGFVCLELGPGDSLYTVPIASAYGAETVFLVDTGHYASDDIGMVQSLVQLLAAQNLVRNLSQIERAVGWEEILECCAGRYFSDGIGSLKAIPDGSVDFSFSNAVLEHVRLRQFRDVIAELRRVMRVGGISSHTVDLRDHLDDSLNNLRFSESLWEGRLFANSGFYTNRIRFSEMLEIMTTSGFLVEHVEPKAWKRIPLSRSSMNARFASMSDQDLITYGFEVILRAV